MNAADVMVSNVITVRPDTSVKQIAEILLSNRISAVPVIDDKDVLLGIVSEGDLIHRVETGTERHRSWWLEFLTGREVLAREFVKSHARYAKDVMSHPVIAVPPEMPLGKIAALLEKHRIKRVPVVNAGKIVGIVSRANLVQALVSFSGTATPDAKVEDSILRKNLLVQLNSQAWWSSNVNVIVHGGIVEMWGVVDTAAERDAIRVAIEAMPGVHNLENHIRVDPRPIAQ